MKTGWQRVLSMAFLVAALGLFMAMHFLPLAREGRRHGWELWISIGQVLRHPSALDPPEVAVIIFSFLTFSLLIIVSPFLGNVWTKSLLAWSMVVTFSGVAATWFLAMFYNGASFGSEMRSGGWCLMISPMLNFVGLLMARPQWLKRSGASEFLNPP